MGGCREEFKGRAGVGVLEGEKEEKEKQRITYLLNMMTSVEEG